MFLSVSRAQTAGSCFMVDIQNLSIGVWFTQLQDRKGGSRRGGMYHFIELEETKLWVCLGTTASLVTVQEAWSWWGKRFTGNCVSNPWHRDSGFCDSGEILVNWGRGIKCLQFTADWPTPSPANCPRPFSDSTVGLWKKRAVFQILLQ